MSPVEYARMSTDQLIAEFARLAIVVRSPFTTLLKTPPVTPEDRLLLRGIREIGAELIARNAIDEIRALFEHQNDDVRGTAGWRFLDTDPDWAMAALDAIGEKVSTKQMMELCAHAQQLPPARPAVSEMTSEQLVARFEDAGMRKYATRFLGGDNEPFDVELSNRIVHEMLDIAGELEARGDLLRLLPLLEHANISVRRAAASRCLHGAPERALPVLETISAIRGVGEPEEGSATSSLWHWRRKQENKAPD